MRAPIFLLFITFLFFSCATKKADEKQIENNTSPKNEYLLEQGVWIGQLNISEEKNIPFNFKITKDSIYIINAEEKIGAQIKKDGELFVIKMPIFDSEFRFSATEKGLFGYWYNYTKGDYKLDFKAYKSASDLKKRFNNSLKEDNRYFDGKWEATFSPNTEEEYKAIGLFYQEKNNVTGTFITETGDYRYLQGNVTGDSIYMSCFDGSHAFLFEGILLESQIEGMFYSGSHWQEHWQAKLNSTFELEDPYSLTEMVDGENFEFSFPNLEGDLVAYPDPNYTGKVVIIQILGSWCPNCMDETMFLTNLYENYKDRGLEIIGLAFEIPEKFEDKIERVKDLKKHFNAKYEFLIAGNANKKEAEKALPALNHILSFPTTLFIDKDGVIRKVHTGFYGPGTGGYYLKYVSEMQDFVEKLLSE